MRTSSREPSKTRGPPTSPKVIPIPQLSEDALRLLVSAFEPLNAPSRYNFVPSILLHTTTAWCQLVSAGDAPIQISTTPYLLTLTLLPCELSMAKTYPVSPAAPRAAIAPLDPGIPGVRNLNHAAMLMLLVSDMNVELLGQLTWLAAP